MNDADGDSTVKTPQPVEQTALPDRFRTLRFLGSGGFGHVYHAVDTRYDAEVAVKVLHASHASSLRRFKDEFTQLSAIATHENLVRLYEGFFDSSPWLFTMEYVDGVNLLVYVQQAAAADREGRIRSCVGQLATAVHTLHLNRCHHRDLKPSNVLVTAAGRVKVIDFGLVREFGDRFEQTVSMVGTLPYMSPEQLLRGTVTESSDWYAVGVMLYELLTGARPSLEPVPPWLSDGQLVPPHRLSADVPEDLSALCVRLLARDPRQRASFADIVPIAHVAEALTLTSRRDTMFVGRELERQRLMEHYEWSRSRPVVVHVSGPSGVGKTTLVRQCLADIRRTNPDAVILAARCHQNRSVRYPTLDDVVDQLSRYLSALSRDRLEQILPRNFAALAKMFPVLEPLRSGLHVLPALESTELRIRGLWALGDLLGRLADRYPVVLSIDDVQWGDREGCAFLSDLLSSADAPRVMLVLSYRSDGGDLASWLEEPRRTEASGEGEHRLPLQLLADAEAATLVQRLLIPALAGDDTLVRQIASVSGRNPYLVREVVEWANARSALAAPLSTVTTDDVLREKVTSLERDSRYLLELVAVAGQPTSLDDLREACRLANVLAARDELRRGRLIRSRVLEGREEIEVYHARVADAVHQMLDAGELAERHRALARALQASPRPDCERIAVHLERAGDLSACSLYARQAGDQAFQALAFERAAHCYQLALKDGVFEKDERLAILTTLAHALANSGHCGEAARCYTDAASLAERRQQLELVARAADQLLRGGYVRQGLTTLDEVMVRLRLKPPRARAALLARVWLWRLRLAVRGLRFDQRRAGRVSEEERLRLEVCWTGAMVTSLIDPLRSAESSARYVLLALRSGDPHHVTTALSCEAPMLFIMPSQRSQAKALEVLETARQLVDEAANPHGTARYLLSKAVVAFLRGEWRMAAEQGDAAAEMLRTRCVNVTWELATAQIFSSAARYIRGDWDENRRRVPIYLREAESRGGSNVVVSLRVQSCAYFSTLAADQPVEALRQLREDLAAWSSEHADFFTCRVMQAEVDIALYSDDPIRAHEAIERDWAKLDRAALLRNPTTFAFLYFTRGRAALAMAARFAQSPRRQAMLERAESAATALERKGPVWSRGMALALRAGIASWKDGADAADGYLHLAERALGDGDIGPVRMAVLYRLGRRVPGQVNQAAGQVDEWARREGIDRVDRIAAALVPGNF